MAEIIGYRPAGYIPPEERDLYACEFCTGYSNGCGCIADPGECPEYQTDWEYYDSLVRMEAAWQREDAALAAKLGR